MFPFAPNGKSVIFRCPRFRCIVGNSILEGLHIPGEQAKSHKSYLPLKFSGKNIEVFPYTLGHKHTVFLRL